MKHQAPQGQNDKSMSLESLKLDQDFLEMSVSFTHEEKDDMSLEQKIKIKKAIWNLDQFTKSQRKEAGRVRMPNIDMFSIGMSIQRQNHMPLRV